MHGNVAEWVVDGYDAKHYVSIQSGASADKAMLWPPDYYSRCIRGGHWDAEAFQCRSAARERSDKEWKISDPNTPRSVWYFTEFWVGFRIARPLAVPDEATRLKFWEPDTDDVVSFVRKGNDKQKRMVVKPQPEKTGE